MIQNLEINNFKSIEHIEFSCNRINLFIGEPNTGKSNILEALGLVNYTHSSNNEIKKFIRFDSIHNVFRDSMVSNGITISIDNKKEFVEMGIKDRLIELSRNGKVICNFNDNGEWSSFNTDSSDSGIRFYKFAEPKIINRNVTKYLNPPNGDNLFTIAYSNKEYRNILSNLTKDAGLKPVFKPNEQKIELQKQEDDIAISYPYITISDTIQRNFFYQLAIKSNKNASLG